MRAVAKQYGMEDIKRRELIDFSSIARRENVPYNVYEIDELYSAEKRAEIDREIVNKKLIKAGYAGKNIYYELAELQAGKPYYIPEDILSYAAGNTVPEETKLLNFLKKLKVTATESENRFGKKLSASMWERPSAAFPSEATMRDLNIVGLAASVPNIRTETKKL